MVEARILDGGAGSCVLCLWLAVWEETRWDWRANGGDGLGHLHSDGVEQIIEPIPMR